MDNFFYVAKNKKKHKTTRVITTAIKKKKNKTFNQLFPLEEKPKQKKRECFREEFLAN